MGCDLTYAQSYPQVWIARDASADRAIRGKTHHTFGWRTVARTRSGSQEASPAWDLWVSSTHNSGLPKPSPRSLQEKTSERRVLITCFWSGRGEGTGKPASAEKGSCFSTSAPSFAFPARLRVNATPRRRHQSSVRVGIDAAC